MMLYVGMFLTIPFILLAVASFFDWWLIGELDNMIGHEFYEERSAGLTSLFIFFTRLADGWFIAIVVIVISLFFILKYKNYRLALWYAATVGLGAGLVNQLVKFLFQRPRPTNINHLIEQGGYSFPSGHAMGSMILYGALAFLIIRLAKHKVTKWLVFIAAGILITLVGASRVYLGVHYPSDIIGGYSLGAAWLALSIGVYGLAWTQVGLPHEDDKRS